MSDSLQPHGLHGLPGSSVHGIFQARVLEWGAISSSRGSSQPRDRTWVSRVVDRWFTFWATREVCLVHYWCSKRKKKKWASSPFAMQESDYRWIFTPEGGYHLGKSLGNTFPSLPPPPALIFFPFHYSPFDLSNPLRSFLNTPLPLPFSSLSSETQLPKFRVQNEWRVTSEVTVHEWLLSVMASCHNLLLCHSTRAHTHTVRAIPIRYCRGVKIEKGKFSGQLRLLEHLAV